MGTMRITRGLRAAEDWAFELGWVQLPGSQLWARNDAAEPRSLEAALEMSLELLYKKEVIVEVIRPYKNPGAKPGRNDSCPCGSGKKHKRCCLSMIQAARLARDNGNITRTSSGSELDCD